MWHSFFSKENVFHQRKMGIFFSSGKVFYVKRNGASKYWKDMLFFPFEVDVPWSVFLFKSFCFIRLKFSPWLKKQWNAFWLMEVSDWRSFFEQTKLHSSILKPGAPTYNSLQCKFSLLLCGKFGSFHPRPNMYMAHSTLPLHALVVKLIKYCVLLLKLDEYNTPYTDLKFIMSIL